MNSDKELYTLLSLIVGGYIFFLGFKGVKMGPYQN